MEEKFLKQVWEALKGDHNDMRKERIILQAARELVSDAITADRKELIEKIKAIKTISFTRDQIISIIENIEN